VKVLIDTNVLVSAILRDKTPETVIIWIVSQEDWAWVVTPSIKAEYIDVLARKKFGLPPEILQKWYSLIDEITIQEEVDLSIDFQRDPKDVKFLACAIAMRADYLITGDKDFADAEKYLHTVVIPVLKFKQLIIDSNEE
jgi:uncharacterized protein